MSVEPAEAAERARQKWSAIAVATSILAISYWAMVFAFLTAEAAEGPAPGPAFAFGMVLAPFVFVTLAVKSRRPGMGGATVAAMLLAVVVAPFASMVARDAITGLVAGFGVGASVALRREEHQPVWARLLAVTGVSAVVFLLLRLVPVVALFVAPAIILPAIGLSDLYMDGKTTQG